MKEQMPCACRRAHVLQAFRRSRLLGTYLDCVLPLRGRLSVEFGHSQLEQLLTLQQILLTTLLCKVPLLLPQQRRTPLRRLPSMQQQWPKYGAPCTNDGSTHCPDQRVQRYCATALLRPP
ncbi:hypothetical protein [Streptomyces sp. SYP-A7185]|uniref:hypothetical protein n=1 Tax=Streptomyces sp. SYP-A7185 TaxID=3040076 RepID=UPI0038F79DD4